MTSPSSNVLKNFLIYISDFPAELCHVTTFRRKVYDNCKRKAYSDADSSTASLSIIRSERFINRIKSIIMKKIILGTLGILTLFLSSCKDDNDDNEGDLTTGLLVTPEVTARVVDPLTTNSFTGILEIFHATQEVRSTTATLSTTTRPSSTDTMSSSTGPHTGPTTGCYTCLPETTTSSIGEHQNTKIQSTTHPPLRNPDYRSEPISLTSTSV